MENLDYWLDYVENIDDQSNKSRHSFQSKEYRGHQEAEDYDYFRRPFPNVAAYKNNNNPKSIFLNFGDETKRIVVPNDFNTIEDVRHLFYAVFSDSSDLERLHNQNAKVYIQDQNRPEIFYELEDLHDIKPKCVLKLHEHVKPAFAHPGSLSTNNVVSKSAANLVNQSKSDDLSSCASETASEPAYQQKGNPRYRTLERPYYAPVQNVNRTKTLSMDLRMLPPPPPSKPRRIYDKTDDSMLSPRRSLDSYERATGQPSSRNHGNFTDNGLFSPMDRPCSTPSRSGSATPIIDEEARARVIGMEKQLADLSTLVHMALMPSKGLGDNLHKDLENLRREILGPPSSSSSFGTGRDDASDSSSLSRCSDLESDRGVSNGGYGLLKENYNGGSNHRYSNGKSRLNSTYSSQEVMQSQLKNLKRRTQDIQTEVKSLKRMVQNNSQTTREVLKDAFDRIKVILNTNQHLRMFADHAKYQNQKNHSTTAIFGVLKDDQEKHAAAIQQLERELSLFEKKVDETRDNVVSGSKRLKIDEVEEFTETLTKIIRSAASEKNKFSNLHERLKEAMNEEMEKFVREEKIFKEEPSKLDNALRRCKKLTGTIITMKKLAMVQDPKGNKNCNAINSSPINSPSKESADTPITHAALSKIPSIQKNGNFTARTPPGKMLDGLLEQLNNVGSDMTSNSDTIKRSPKSPQADDQMTNNGLLKKSTGDFSDSSTCSSVKSNGTLTGASKPNYDQNFIYKSPRSQSPRNLSNGFSLAPPPPPPPPIRSSSSMNNNVNRPIIYDFGCTKNYLPTAPMIHTNAVDSCGEDFRSPVNFRSTTTAKVAASSNESINSQERSSKPPPPPPPPRNRQEMMEYRQHELNTKQQQQLKFRNNNNGLRA